MTRSPALVTSLLALLLGACGGAGTSSYGEPAEASDAARTVEIEALDELAFDPETVAVAPGEVVTFRVTNVGEIEHEFVLGPEDVQSDAEAAMADDGGGHGGHGDQGNAIVMAPGETAELTWRFPEEGIGDILYGCHLPGHYAGGMRGGIVAGS
ncbi:MAG: hypothetical protein KY461_02100 [Actinobacteria bacterium]|nr:hypothetical protein [Actinomycetota bacterium]